MKVLSLICLFCLLATAHSQTVYKTIDAEGKVFYSTIEPDENSHSKVVDFPPEPSQEDIDAALQEQKKLQQTLEKQQQKRQQEKQKAEELEQNKKIKRKVKQEENAVPGFLF